MRPLLLLSLSISLLAITSCSAPKIDYEGCGPRLLFWAIGPKPEEPFLDVCYTQLDITEMQQYFDYVPIAGFNKDTRQPLDNNQDGISGNGQVFNQDRIHWGGNGCSHYARRIVQQGCSRLGNASRTGGCEWVALQITPKSGISKGLVSLTPVSHVRLSDGTEQNNYAKTLTTAFSNCP
ncbi:hypothetical protein [Candidatus Venteria ishoeyi]|uniref:Uncharacterized protein n=1 Tax=Candidatus Venteria ishoeyi TaxID=1899563 RepID=A0A1H6FFG4_9GAMM|nr:hypothetical protein [Candidatus Venteria ishoeyi]MDM8547416.1 hypothetical protein [Candidatus Venteria ishoeyi]SEH08810.1 Uncharacterised protein [Candidatus Venteria ishoeyi]